MSAPTTLRDVTNASEHAVDQALETASSLLPPSALLLHRAMLRRAQFGSHCAASSEALAAEIGRHPDTVKKMRARLLEAGLWVVNDQNGGRGRRARYTPVVTASP